MMAIRERRKRCSSDDEAKKTQLMELPMDILVDILLKMPAKSVACIKCVSRTLLNSVSNISFSTTHTRSHISTAAAADRRLMCCFRDDRFVTFQSLKYKDDDNTLTKAGRYAVTVSSSRSAPWFPRFVFRNLFCLGTKNGDCILVNALAGERGLLRLPESRIESGPPRPYKVYRASVTFGMGFDDETNTYKIVRVVQETEAETYKLKSNTAHVLVLGTNSWRQIFSLPPCKLCWRSDEPVCANGAVHWLTLSNLDQKVVSFDLRREEFCWTSTPHKYWEMDVIGLFSLRGCLAVLETTRSRSRTEIWVLKSEQQQKRWVRYYCYNNKLPSGYEYPCDNSLGEWEHGIYFTTTHHIPYTWAVFFIDLRFGSITRVEYPFPNTYLLGLYQYSETLISLKDYGDLEDAHHQVIVG